MSGKLPPPERFDFSRPAGWPEWKRWFLRYRAAIKLERESADVQISTLIYSMGKEADNIFTQFPDVDDGVTTSEHGEAEKKFIKVLKLFDDYFVPERNVIHERAKFHSAVQKPTQKVESFVRELHELAEHCLFQNTSVRDESIRDQLVFGLKDKKTNKKAAVREGSTTPESRRYGEKF
ncbi:Pol polyprotein [Elysia marginata]|uniref:Pol polyprotein n=1 Tax=Elysia marginata TaxID=1093978 RepID=A0AAV4FIM5_9GAST|nr:Pol polyprotein [Elysia marginata]